MFLAEKSGTIFARGWVRGDREGAEMEDSLQFIDQCAYPCTQHYPVDDTKCFFYVRCLDNQGLRLFSDGNEGNIPSAKIRRMVTTFHLSFSIKQ